MDGTDLLARIATINLNGLRHFLIPTNPTRTAVLSLLPVVYIVKIFLDWRRLSHVPGRFWWSISPFPLLRAQLGGHAHKTLSDITSEFGPLVRIGPNAVLTTDYKHIQKMDAPKSAYRKGDWYTTFRFQKGIDHSFSLVDEVAHSRLRTKMGPGYSASNLVEDAIDRQLLRLIHVLESNHVNHAPLSSLTTPASTTTYTSRSPITLRRIDLTTITQFLALDIVGDMTFGQPFGFLDNGEDIYDWIAWNEDFFPVASTAATFPFLSRLVQIWPFCEVLPKGTDRSGMGRFIRAAEETLDERAKPGAKARKDMIDTFIKQGLNRTEAISEALVQIVAGTDSVAVVLRMAILYIHSNPRIYNRVMSEIDAMKTKLPSPPPASSSLAILSDDCASRARDQLLDMNVSTTIIRDADAKTLPYLQAVIRETLRIFPPQTPLLNKAVPEGGDVVAGYELPGGTQVGMDGWGILRSTQFWGPDADIFCPERWLEASPERYEEMVNCSECLFGYGRFKCLGRSVAYMELSKTLPELLYRYEITMVNPIQPLEKMHSAAFWMMSGLWATFSPRVVARMGVRSATESGL